MSKTTLDDFQDGRALVKYEQYSEPPNYSGLNPQCPYCAFTFTPEQGKVLNKAKIVTVTGLDGKKRKMEIGNTSQTRCQCPNCHAIMYKKTAYKVAAMTVEEYGREVFFLRKWDVDRKVKFESIKSWLKLNRCASQFWNGYMNERNKDPEYLSRHPEVAEKLEEERIAEQWKEYENAQKSENATM
jgi:hypothetical protein